MKTPRTRMLETIKEQGPFTLEAWAFESDVKESQAEIVVGGLIKNGLVRVMRGGIYHYAESCDRG